MIIFKEINKYPHIRCAFFSRKNGISDGIYKSLNCGLNSKDKKTSSIIFGSVGEYIWVKDEEILDVITAISGSGPAYYFYLTEMLTKYIRA